MDVIRTKENIAQHAAGHVHNLLADGGGVPIMLMFSRGAPLAVCDYLNLSELPEEVTITVLDERYAFTEDDLNYDALSQTDFFKTCVASGCEVINPRPLPLEPLEETAARFAGSLRGWRDVNEDMDARVIAIHEVGADGGIAGIMPMPDSEKRFNELFVSTDKWVVGYEGNSKEHKHPSRITTTIPFLRDVVTHSVVLVEEDVDDVVRTLNQEGSLATVPARIVANAREVFLFANIE